MSDDPDADDAAQGGGDPVEGLAAVLAGHQVDSQRDGDWLLLPRGCRATARFHVRGEAPVIQLDVMFEPWTGCQVVESVVGVGPSREQREAGAWQAFTAASLHVLLAAFLYHEEVPVERTAWQIHGSTRAVTIGPVVGRGTDPGERGWLDAVRDVIEGSNLPEGTHWIRVFYAHDHRAKLACEVLLDNQPWPEARDIVEEIEWPVRDDYYSVRLFLVVQGGTDVSRAVALFADQPGLDDDDYARALIAAGADPGDAALMVAMVPLAFGRVMVEGLEVGFSPTATVQRRGGGPPAEVVLDDHPIFSEAAFLAERSQEQGTLSRDQFLSIALRSAEIDALNQALEAGAQPADLEFAPPIVSVP